MPGLLQSNNTQTHTTFVIVKIFRWVPPRVITTIDASSHITIKFDEIYRQERAILFNDKFFGQSEIDFSSAKM